MTWLYVPEPISASVPATAGSTTPSPERFAELSRSATWRSEPRSPASWRAAWKKAPSLRRLCGPTLRVVKSRRANAPALLVTARGATPRMEPVMPLQPIMRTCRTCNATFAQKRSWVARAFCSRKCSALDREQRLRERRIPRRCVRCDAVIVGGKKRRDRKYCSRECFASRPQQRDPLTAQRRKLAQLACGLVARCLRYVGRSKLASTATILGYGHLQLAAHLESRWLPGMSWGNYGRGGWVVDHIRPVSSFPLDTPLSEICALSNLQPLWERDNLRKGRRYEAASVIGHRATATVATDSAPSATASSRPRPKRRSASSGARRSARTCEVAS